MVLDICGERRIENPSDEEIWDALVGLNPTENDAFAILGADGMTYVQTSGGATSGFVLEYQEGAIKEHYQSADKKLPLEVVAGCFMQFRDGEADWAERVAFEKMTM